MTTAFMKRVIHGLCAAVLAGAVTGAGASAGAALITHEHTVRARSTAPGMAGADVNLYVREVARTGADPDGARIAERVVLFIHGAGTPGEVAFDVRVRDYSWMAFLAEAGFDVFAMDVTGYGRSTRPPPMGDPCNLSRAQQQPLIPAVMPAACNASWDGPITTMASDWNDIGAVVDHLRQLRGVERIALIGFSLGGARAMGYVKRNPGKVSRVVLLAPSYSRDQPDEPTGLLPQGASPMMTQSRVEFDAGWDRQVGCPGQYERQVSDAVWREMLASDPVAAGWGAGVRRVPFVPAAGFNQSSAAQMRTPTLVISGAQDEQIPQSRVRELYRDLGSPRKLFVDLACSSHNAMWERNHLLLFGASLQWLRSGTVEGRREGELRLGY